MVLLFVLVVDDVLCFERYFCFLLFIVVGGRLSVVSWWLVGDGCCWSVLAVVGGWLVLAVVGRGWLLLVGGWCLLLLVSCVGCWDLVIGLACSW